MSRPAWFGGRVRLLRVIVLALVLDLSTGAAQTARAANAETVEQQITLVDKTRVVKASMGFAGSATRRIDVKVWRAKTHKGLLPLIRQPRHIWRG